MLQIARKTRYPAIRPVSEELITEFYTVRNIRTIPEIDKVYINQRLSAYFNLRE